MILLSATLKSR